MSEPSQDKQDQSSREVSSSAIKSLPPIEQALIEPALLGKVSGVPALLSWVIGLLALLALIIAVLYVGSLERTIAIVRSAHPAWLLLALAVQGATYVSAALVWRQTLRRAGHPRSLWTLVLLAGAKLFTDQALPSSGISGTMLVVSGLMRRHVPAEVAMAAMVAGLVSFDIAYLTVVLTSAGILWLHGRANLALVIGVAVFAVITIAVPTTVLGLKRWGNRWPISWFSRLPRMAILFRALAEAPTDLLGSPGLIIQATGLQLGIFIFDSLTLWLAFKAVGEVPEAWVVFVSFAIASMVATIGPIPVGLGTFEAGSVAMLSFLGVSIEEALAGTLLLRGLTFWLPMLPGIWLARREIGCL
jgi:uncharacterized protein (TIRG00374 family)